MINYIKGDATNPVGDGQKLIIHVCNDIGAWGAGFVLALSKKWKEPETAYKAWSRTKNQPNSDFSLGAIEIIQVAPDIDVVNMIGQKGIKTVNGASPVRYDAIRQALKSVAKYALATKASVHAPRFGAGLAGGKWETIEQIINEELISQGVSVTVYDFQ